MNSVAVMTMPQGSLLYIACNSVERNKENEEPVEPVGGSLSQTTYQVLITVTPHEEGNTPHNITKNNKLFGSADADDVVLRIIESCDVHITVILNVHTNKIQQSFQ